MTSQTSSVTCTATDDVDNDPLTYSYEWFIDNQVQTETSDSLSGPFSVLSQITCRATTGDGKQMAMPLRQA